MDALKDMHACLLTNTVHSTHARHLRFAHVALQTFMRFFAATSHGTHGKSKQVLALAGEETVLWHLPLRATVGGWQCTAVSERT